MLHTVSQKIQNCATGSQHCLFFVIKIDVSIPRSICIQNYSKNKWDLNTVNSWRLYDPWPVILFRLHSSAARCSEPCITQHRSRAPLLPPPYSVDSTNSLLLPQQSRDTASFMSKRSEWKWVNCLRRRPALLTNSVDEVTGTLQPIWPEVNCLPMTVGGSHLVDYLSDDVRVTM